MVVWELNENEWNDSLSFESCFIKERIVLGLLRCLLLLALFCNIGLIMLHGGVEVVVVVVGVVIIEELNLCNDIFYRCCLSLGR